MRSVLSPFLIFERVEERFRPLRGGGEGRGSLMALSCPQE